MYQVHYYTTANGEDVVRDFVRSLDPKTREKIVYMINLLKEWGPNLRRPYADVVRGKIRELRIRFASDQIRILYFFFLGEYIVFVHGFRKKRDKIPVSEIEKAERNMFDFMIRYQKGGITL